MKKIFTLILSAVFLCFVFAFVGCGKNKPTGSNTTASSSLSEMTQSTSQSKTSSESTSFRETTQTTQASDTSDTSEFFESSNGTLESTANPEDTLPSPLRKK
ncbi:MAG: hypothetical protein IKW18_00855 [Clostridia bacterium]|nr:hypothetical protein [Clostridia bacterium]